MKTNFLSLPVSMLLLAASAAALAQDEYASEDTSYEASNADTVVYDAPTTYYSSVVYQSAVVYNAPVFYIGAAVTMAADSEMQRSCEPAAVASTVTVIGAHGGVYTYSNQTTTACNDSTIVQFGQRGGWFGGRW
jgi:hypothetical protein